MTAATQSLPDLLSLRSGLHWDVTWDHPGRRSLEASVVRTRIDGGPALPIPPSRCPNQKISLVLTPEVNTFINVVMIVFL